MYITCVAVHIHVHVQLKYMDIVCGAVHIQLNTYIVHVQLETVLVAIMHRPVQYPSKFAQLLVVRV